jgi:hypothetical protein
VTSWRSIIRLARLRTRTFSKLVTQQEWEANIYIINTNSVKSTEWYSNWKNFQREMDIPECNRSIEARQHIGQVGNNEPMQTTAVPLSLASHLRRHCGGDLLQTTILDHVFQGVRPRLQHRRASAHGYSAPAMLRDPTSPIGVTVPYGKRKKMTISRNDNAKPSAGVYADTEKLPRIFKLNCGNKHQISPHSWTRDGFRSGNRMPNGSHTGPQSGAGDWGSNGAGSGHRRASRTCLSLN